MSLDRLSCHTSEIYGVTKTNTNGRIQENTVYIGTIQCRFTPQSTSQFNVADVETVDNIDKLVYTGLEILSLQNTIGGTTYKFSDFDTFRMITANTGISGTYESTSPVNVCYGFNGPHHVEFTVKKVI